MDNTDPQQTPATNINPEPNQETAPAQPQPQPEVTEPLQPQTPANPETVAPTQTFAAVPAPIPVTQVVPTGSQEVPQPVVADTQPVAPVASPAQPAAPAPEKHSQVWGILSLVSLFMGIALVGLVLGIIGLRKAKKLGQKDTLSLIGVILNAIVVTLAVLALALIFGGAVLLSKNSNDVERKFDINTIASELNTYYTKTGVYPLSKEINNDTWRQTNFANVTNETYRDPKGVSNTYLLSTEPGSNIYAYRVYEIDGVTTCTEAAKCKKFVLTATLNNEANGSFVYNVSSENQ